MKNFLKSLVLIVIINVLGVNLAYSQCTNSSSYGSGTAGTVSGSTVTIATCQYQTEYSTVSGIVSGYVYTLTNTAGGYVTVHSGSSGGPVIAQGNAPLTFTASVTGTIYPSWNTNAACGTASPCSTTSIVTVTGAPPPPPATNDKCNTAIALTPATTCSSTVGSLGTSQSLAGCSGTANDDVWYSFVAAATSQNISLTASASMDPVVQVFSGTCASLTSINCNDAAFTTGGSGSYTATGLTVGNTYYYRVYDYYSGTPSTTTFTTCVTTPPPLPTCVGNSPPGNTCATATPICDLDGYCGSTTGYTANSWGQLNTAFCGSIENNSFLTFVASSSSISFNLWVTSFTMGYGIQIFIFQATGCSGAVSSFTCYNPGTANYGPTPITATGLTPGQTYYMMIDGNSGDIVNYVIGANSGVNVPVTVTPSTASVCQGTPVNLTAAGGNGSYTWSPAGGLSATTGASVTATQAAVGTYTYTATSSTGNPLCPSSTTASATVTVTNCGCTVTASNSGPVCAGGSLTLSATSAGAGLQLCLDWSFWIYIWC
ncbi:MAG: hypothetical protein IPG89_15535 [Bacteroidetes bacterium]|nr:hypothetical protein [Bacteroidota bacterium]